MAMKRAKHGARITKRRHRPAVKVWVPRDLRGRYIGPSGHPVESVVKILRSGTHDQIRRQADIAIADIQAEFDRASAGLSHHTIPTDKVREVAEQEGRRAYDQLAARFLLDRHELPKLAEEIATQIMWVEILERENPLLTNAVTADYARVQLRRLGFEPTAESVEKLATAILTAQRNAIEAIQTGVVLPPMPAQPRAPKAFAGPAVEIEALAEKWMAEKKYQPKAAYQHRGKLAVLYEHHKTVAEIDRRIAGAFVTEVLAKRETGRKGRTLMSATTIGSYLSTYAQLWRWMERRGHVEANPWTNQRMDQNGEDDVEGDRRGFTEQEAGQFLAALEGADADVVTIAAVTGMRLEEIAALKCSDAAVQHRVAWLTIREGKTASAARRVPIIVAPVRKMLAKRKKAGKGRLFHELKADRFGDYGSALSKRVGRMLRAIGLTDPNLVADHSWRHRARTLMERAEVAPWVADWVLGHARPGEGLGRYSEGPSDEQMIGAVKAIKLPA